MILTPLLGDGGSNHRCVSVINLTYRWESIITFGKGRIVTLGTSDEITLLSTKPGQIKGLKYKAKMRTVILTSTGVNLIYHTPNQASKDTLISIPMLK